MPVVFKLYGLYFSSISVKSTNPLSSSYFLYAHIDNNVLLSITPDAFIYFFFSTFQF